MEMSSPPLLTSPAVTIALIAATIAVIFLAANFTTINAQEEEQQQQQQLTRESSAIENRTATTQSTEDSISVRIPHGWIIQDVNNTGFVLGAEVLQGYGILAQLCPEEEQQHQGAPLPIASGNISSSSSTRSKGCQGAQEEVIHIVRFPNLGARVGMSSEAVSTIDNITPDSILAYQMQKLQEVGYRNIRIVNSTDTTINVVGTGLNNNNNNVIATVPAKLVEMTYSTASAPNEARRGYLVSTATDATPRNLGMITGYSIFYEGNSTAADAQEQTTLLPSGSLPRPLSSSVGQVFDSFELIAAPEVEQTVLVARAAQAEQEEAADILTVEMISNGTEGVAPATFEFEADITGGTQPYTISWDFEDGSGGGDEETVLRTFSEAGSYNIAVTAADSIGQTTSDSIEITVEVPPLEDSPTVEEPLAEETQETACNSSYPDMCIPPPPPNLTCDDVGARNFEVVPPDPHGFDGDNDEIGCETGTNPPDFESDDNNSVSDGSVNLGGLIDNLIDGIINPSSP
jgi:PKD repeat protein